MEIKMNPLMFDEIYLPLFDSKKDYNIVYGGAGSGKSYAIGIYMVMWALQGRAILSTISFATRIKDSTWAECIGAINRFHLQEYFTILLSARTIISNVSTGQIKFMGLDDVTKLRSIRPLNKMAFDDIICEEATDLHEDTFNLLLTRQRGESNFLKRVWLVFNPVYLSHWIYQRFFKNREHLQDYSQNEFTIDDDDTLIVKTTYRNNKGMDEQSIKRLTDAGANDIYYRDVYLDGNFGVLGDLIFPNWSEVTIENIPKNLQIKCGIDYGYSDALTFTISMYDKQKREIYILDGLSYTKLSDLKIFADAVKHMLAHWGLNEKQLICGDSSDPRSGDVLKGFGLNVRGAIKGAGSKFAGLMFLKTHKIFILESFFKFKESMRIYTWKKNKDGSSTDETNHQGSDLIDSVRYALESEMRNYKAPFSVKGDIF